jgi:signal transduction histidine kinase
MKELEKAYARVMESEKMKAAFIQNVSHEVRTPLNIISGFSQVIANPELTDSVEDRQNMSKMMQKSAHQITSLIDEIIGLSLIESTEKMRKEDTPQVNALLKNVLRDYDDVVNDGVELKLETTLADDFSITTNENMLKRILTALLENACKYTEKGSIKLKAAQADSTLFISVEDTGCGIPKEKAHEIFERFVKLDSFKEGIGLGLPLSLKLAEQLDGTVELDTSYTNGARFNVKLPIQ